LKIGSDIDRLGNIVDVYYVDNIVNHPIEQLYRNGHAELLERGWDWPMTEAQWKESDKFIGIYAEQDNKILGCIIIEIRISKSLHKILSYVTPDNREKGIFKIMHKYLDKIALDNDCNFITGIVHVKNHEHLRILEKLGITPVSILMGKKVK